MPSNFTSNSTDLDDLFIQRKYTIFDDYGALPGSIWSWGFNNTGQLALGNIVHRSSPVQIGALTDWKQVDIGSGSNLAVKTDGTLWVWGSNAYGKLGLGDVVHRSSPIQVGALTNWKQVSVSWYHSTAIKTDGTLWVWGHTSRSYSVGGIAGPLSSPTQIGTLTNWRQVSAGAWFTTAIKTDGTLWATGRVGGGGFGGSSDLASFTQIGTLTNWKQTSGSTCDVGTAAIKIDGSLWMGGYARDGFLGNGTSSPNIFSPIQIGSLTDWKLVSAGFYSAAAIKTNGTLWTWGNNSNGQLGDGTIVHRSSPIQIGALTNWKEIYHSKQGSSVSTKTDGTLWAWGNNTYGQLGDGTRNHRSSPVQVGALTNWKQASAENSIFAISSIY